MSRRPPILRLRTRITLLVCLTVLLALSITGLLITWRQEIRTRESLEAKADMVSRLSSEAEAVVHGLTGQRPWVEIQPFAERLRQTTGMDYIVVLDMKGVRASHPDPALIGHRFVGGDEGRVLQGESYRSVAEGTLGQALRVFRPVRTPAGRQVGAVVVGVLAVGIDQNVLVVRRMVLVGLLVGLLVGIAGAVIVAARIKGILLGMEPSEIAAVLEQRSAILHSVREGVLAVDPNLNITLVNEEAARLFHRVGLPADLVGQPLGTVLPDSALAEVIGSGRPRFDDALSLKGLQVLANQVPVVVDEDIVGAVATFRDKTELRQMAEQLTGVRLYADALRAQTHEFMNKLHVILGLIRLGEHEKLGAYITGITQQLQGEMGEVLRRIKDPVIAGFLMARFASAREQDVTLHLSEDSSLPAVLGEALEQDLVTVLGNLLENALEAIGASERRELHLHLGIEEDHLLLRIADSGLGLDPAQLTQLCAKGYSTKGPHRGFGLHHVQHCVQARGGSLEVENLPEGGAAFTVTLELPREEQGL